jgi:hypothetical protein
MENDKCTYSQNKCAYSQKCNSLHSGQSGYKPSTLKIDLILWHTQLIVCAVKF